MRVLIGCEESGKVRDSFERLGHDAWSCDLVPSRSGGKHIQADILEVLTNPKKYGYWDIIILFPECTKMCVSGNRWYGSTSERHQERLDAVDWTYALWEVTKHVAKIGCALENPTSVLWTRIGKPQYIQPWEFGHGETKKTGILTHNLPELKPTNIVEGREQRIWRMPPGLNRARDRSETYQGIADAMAEQWG